MANPVEVWKARKHGLDVWPDVERHAAAGTPMNQIDPSDLDRMKWYGFFYRKRDEPGRYICNPEVLPEQRFPGEAPIFAVHYTGLGHDDAWQEMVLGLVVAFLATIMGAWLLGNASTRILSRYGSRFIFFATVGVVVAVIGLLARFGLATHTMSDAVILGVHDLAGWVLAGILVAWKVTPGVAHN